MLLKLIPHLSLPPFVFFSLPPIYLENVVLCHSAIFMASNDELIKCTPDGRSDLCIFHHNLPGKEEKIILPDEYYYIVVGMFGTGWY